MRSPGVRAAVLATRGWRPPPCRHERAPLAAEFLALAHAQSEQAAGQDVAFLTLKILSADREDVADRVPPRCRSDGLHGCFADETADVVMVGDRISHLPGNLRRGPEHGQVADFLRCLGVRYEQVGETLPYVANRAVGSGVTAMPSGLGVSRN